MDGTEEPVIDRVQLREERKQRKKEKRLSKQLLRQKQTEESANILKVRTQGANVSIISKEFADQVSISKKSTLNKFVCNNDSPFLSEPQNKSKTFSNGVESASEINCNILRNSGFDTSSNKKCKKSDPIQVNLLTILNQEKTKKSKKVKEHMQSTHIICGNPLDNTKPVRKVGKFYENPKEKRKSTLKQNIQADRAHCSNDGSKTDEIHNYMYYDNIITTTLNELLETFIKEIVTFQEKLYNKDPLKGNIKKRYIVGFHETKKFLKAHRVKFLIIASNIKVMENGSLHDIINELVALAKDNNIPYVFGSKRKTLGILTKKFISVSCIGVLNYEGVELLYADLQKEVERTKDAYKNYFCESGEEKVYTSLLEKLQ